MRPKFLSVFADVALPHLDGFEDMSEEDLEDWWDEHEESVLALLVTEEGPQISQMN